MHLVRRTPGLRPLTLALLLGCTACGEAPDTFHEDNINPTQLSAAGGELVYTPVPPCRIVDTRNAGGVLAAGEAREYDVRGAVAAQGGEAGGCASPVGEPAAAHINITVVPVGSGNIKAFPATARSQSVSVVNFSSGGQNLANATTVQTCEGCSKDIGIEARFGDAHVIIDVLGYFSSTAVPNDPNKGYVLTPVAPCRIVDTRNAGGALGPNQSRSYDIYGAVSGQGGQASGCPAPRGEPRAVHLSVIAVPQGTGRGRLTVRPPGSAQSRVHVFYDGNFQNITNSFSVQTRHDPAQKDIELFNRDGNTHVVVTVLGYYYEYNDDPAANQDLTYALASPCRIVDTRRGGGKLQAGESRSYRVGGNVSSQGGSSAGCTAPAGNVRAVHLNVVAVPRSGGGNIAAGASSSVPAIVTYDVAAQNVANAAVVRTAVGPATSPILTVRNRYGEADVVVDIVGYYMATGSAPTGCGACSDGLVCDDGECVPPNIVMIMLDDADYRDFKMHNPTTSIRAPSIDALADSGLVFNNFYTNSPVCSPTRVSLQSGNYPARYGVSQIIRRWVRRGLPPDVTTIAEYLKSQGYATGHVGKWHLGEEWHLGVYQGDPKQRYRPSNQGYDYSLAGDFDGYWKTDVYENDVRESPTGQHLTERFTDGALAFLSRHQNERFFLNLAYYAPHSPLEPPPSWASQYPNTKAGKYSALLSHVDEQIGRVLARIDDLGLRNRTAVLLMSDNGGRYDVHPNHTKSTLRGYKGTVFEGGIRTPMIVRWPGLTTAGSRNNSVAAVMDIYPTIADLLGDNPSRLGLDSESFASALDGGLWQRSKPLFWQQFSDSSEGYTAGYIHDFAVRDGKWKLVKEAGALYLFDISNDRAETNNLRSAQPAVVSRLLAEFSDWRTTVPRLPTNVDSTAGAVSRSGDNFTFTGRGHVLLEDHSLHDFDDGEFSVRFRIKAGRIGNQRIIGKTNKWRLRLDENNNLGLRVVDAATGVATELTGTTPLQVGVWYDVAVSLYNHDFAPSMLAEVYLDGALEVEGDAAESVPFVSEALKLSTNVASPAYFVGEIEGLEVFAGTLTARDL